MGAIGGGLGWCRRRKLYGGSFTAISGLGIFSKRVARDLDMTVVVEVVISFYICKILIF